MCIHAHIIALVVSHPGLFMFVLESIQSAASALAAGAGQAAFGNPNIGIPNGVGGSPGIGAQAGLAGMGAASLGNGALESSPLGGGTSLLGGPGGMMLGGNGFGGGSMKKVCNFPINLVAMQLSCAVLNWIV